MDDDRDLHEQEDLSIFGWTGYPDPTVGFGAADLEPRKIVAQEDLSVFGDTYPGVPNPLVGHVHPYPTRFHGPNWNQPMFTQPWVERPYAQAPFTGLGDAVSDAMASGAYAQTKAAIQTALAMDVQAGVQPCVSTLITCIEDPDALTAIWIRGVPDELQYRIQGLQVAGYAQTARAFQSRLAQTQATPAPASSSAAVPPSSPYSPQALLAQLSSPLWRTIAAVSTAVSAYHGYKRNNSVGWALWWGFCGGFAPIVTPAIALAQGYGKPRGKK
jgi:hypothetical protein